MLGTRVCVEVIFVRGETLSASRPGGDKEVTNGENLRAEHEIREILARLNSMSSLLEQVKREQLNNMFGNVENVCHQPRGP